MRGRRRVVLGGVAVAIACCVTGCDPGVAGLFAVGRPSADPSGLDIVFGHCRGDTELQTDWLTGVELRARPEPAPTDAVGSTLDTDSYTQLDYSRVVWSIQSEEPRSLGSVEVGAVPQGFIEAVPLTEALPGQALLVVHSYDPQSGERSNDLGIVLADLPLASSKVLAGSDVVSREAFAERIRQDECGEGVATTFGHDFTPLLWRALLVVMGVFGLVVGALAVSRRREPHPGSALGE